MGIFTEFMWMLAGGSYAAGKSLSNSLFSPAPPEGPYVKGYCKQWYRENWSKLNHKRQRELGKIYMTNINEYYAIANQVKCSCFSTSPIDDRRWSDQTEMSRWYPENGDECTNRWLRFSIQAIARYEGWEADISAPMIIHMKTNYDEPTEAEKELGEHNPPNKLLITNPEREAELYAKVKLAQAGVEAERQYFLNYPPINNDSGDPLSAEHWRNCVEEYCFQGIPIYKMIIPDQVAQDKRLMYGTIYVQRQDFFVNIIMKAEGFAPYSLAFLCAPFGEGMMEHVGISYNPGWTAIKDLIDQKTEELIAKYQDHERQEELLRMLHYASNGSKDAKRDFYALTFTDDEPEDAEEAEELAEEIEQLIDDPDEHKETFGKNGDALFSLKCLARKEGWLWDDDFPSRQRRLQLDDMYDREKSYTDPTILPYNHERQEELFKARFKAAEQRDKESRDKLLVFTGTRNSHTMKEEKFFTLCQTCAKDEDWSWDRTYLTPEKCREIIRQCVAEKTE